MPRSIQLAVAAALILTTGFVHGMWTRRWNPSHELEEAAARLQRAPEDLPGWKASPYEIDANVLTRARASSSWSRTYRQDGTKEAITVILLCGRSGPMSVHRPEHCYSAAGYDLIGATTPTTVNDGDGAKAVFRTALFSKPTPEGTASLRIFWSWHTGNAWQAPDSPRLAFANLPALYKLYVIRHAARAQERLESDPAREFLQLLLPELDKALASP